MNKFKLNFIILFFAVPFILGAQDFMIQAWYWDYAKPCNGASNNWAQTLQANVSNMGCFSYAWLPPLSRASFGNCSNGYDPKDLYDLGEYGLGATGFGTRGEVDALISTLNSNGIQAVADVVYNHRDGGDPEVNPSVKNYITNYFSVGKNPFPSDRFRIVLPIGGATGNGAGDYYLKIKSKTESAIYHNKAYKIYVETDVVAWQGLADLTEAEPNGGGDCGQGSNTITLGRNLTANIDALGCKRDEFKLTLNASDFNSAGDKLYIYITNVNGDYSDHYVYDIWNDAASSAVGSQLLYETYTDFTAMPSGQGGMNYLNFRPNSNNESTTSLSGDKDWLWFFNDYDQTVSSTQSVLFDWSDWLWDDVGIRGYRMDAVKHIEDFFIGDLMDHLNNTGRSPGIVVGELFDTNAGNLKGWIDAVKSHMDGSTLGSVQIRAFDFSLRSALKDACDAFGYDARNIFNAGIVDGANGTGFEAITFVNNHDYRGPGEPVQNDPMLAYAYILTNNQVGLPSVFYPDYFGTSIPNAPVSNLKSQIDELMNIHKSYITNSNVVDYLSRTSTPYGQNFSGGFANTTVFFQLGGGVGGKDILVGINFAGEELDVTHGTNNDIDGDGILNYSVGSTFTELTNTSNSPTLTANSNYEVNFKIPARSYAVWVSGGPLPVELVDFQLKSNKKQAQLDWTTAHEIDLAGFEIQRSLNGRDFKKVSWLDAKGSDGDHTKYQFMDQANIFNQTLYYRLKMTDHSGDFSYSPIKSLVLKDKPQFEIIPNPTNGELQIRLDHQSLETSGEVSIFNTLGTRVWNRSILINRDGIRLDIGELNSGIYLIQISGNDGIYWSEQILKK